MNEITLLIVDDHPLFRQGVVDALSTESDMRVVGEAASGDEALELLRRLRPTVAILDVNLPGMNGQQITHHARQEGLPTRIFLMTGYDDVEQAIHAAIAGAYGYSAKDVETASLAGMIREIVGGKYVIGKNVFTKRELEAWVDEQLEGVRQTYSEPGNPFHPLSDREMQVLECIVRGLSNKEIGAHLGISQQTAKNHITAILRKFGVEDRTQAAVLALKRGWVSLKEANARPQE